VHVDETWGNDQTGGVDHVRLFRDRLTAIE
jgi:hypothetical protein